MRFFTLPFRFCSDTLADFVYNKVQNIRTLGSFVLHLGKKTRKTILVKEGLQCLCWMIFSVPSRHKFRRRVHFVCIMKCLLQCLA